MVLKLTGITLPSSLTYPNLTDFELFSVMASPPVTDGLVGSYFLGTKNADPTYNFANPSLPLLQNGTPNFTAQYATCSRNGGYFDTQLKSTTEMTIFAINLVSGAGGLIQVVSNFQVVSGTGALQGDALFSLSTAAQAAAQQTTGGSIAAVQSVSDAPDGDFKVSAMAVLSTPSVLAAYWNDALTMQSTTTNMTDRGIVTDNLLIGASPATDDFLQNTSISAVLIYNRALPETSGQMEQVFAWLRSTVGVQAGIWSS